MTYLRAWQKLKVYSEDIADFVPISLGIMPYNT